MGFYNVGGGRAPLSHAVTGLRTSRDLDKWPPWCQRHRGVTGPRLVDQNLRFFPQELHPVHAQEHPSASLLPQE